MYYILGRTKMIKFIEAEHQKDVIIYRPLSQVLFFIAAIPLRYVLVVETHELVSIMLRGYFN